MQEKNAFMNEHNERIESGMLLPLLQQCERGWRERRLRPLSPLRKRHLRLLQLRLRLRLLPPRLLLLIPLLLLLLLRLLLQLLLLLLLLPVLPKLLLPRE